MQHPYSQIMLQDFFKQILFTFRILLKRPSFTLVVILTLAIGIGACAAVFTVVNSVLLKPLPFDSPDQLVLIPNLNKDGGGKIEEYGVSLSDFLDWRERNRSFQGLAAMQPTEVALTGTADPEQMDAGIITANLFSLLGVRPYAGRFFNSNEETANSTAVILSFGLWHRRFGGDTSVIGRTMMVDGKALEIVGVAPKDFYFAANAELWLPLNLHVPASPRIATHNTAVVGRLREGVTVEQASGEMKDIAAALAREFQENRGWGARALPVQEPYLRDVRKILYFLFAAVLVLLLIVCVNVFNVVLVRTVERSGEFLLRLALGSTRRQILLGGLMENLVLTLSGGILGLALAAAALKPIIALNPLVATSPSGNRILNSVHIDSDVVLFVFAVCIFISLILSAVPLFRTSKPPIFEVLKSGGRRSMGALQERRFQALFVIIQLAVSFLLLVGAALMMQSFLRMKNSDPGFKTESLLTARLSLPESRYSTHEQRMQFQRLALAKIDAIPGVQSASATTRLPLNEFAMTTLFEVDGASNPDGGLVANFRRIGPSYFETMGTMIENGREFLDTDDPTGAPVAIVSHEMARRLWPGQPAIGKRIRRLSRSDRDWRTIVGVVKDVKDSSLSSDPSMTLYIPYYQQGFSSFHLVIRSAGAAENILEPLRNAIREIDKDLPLYQVSTAEDLLIRSLSRPRFAAYLLGGFALIGIFVALIGMYGVISYSTSRRVNEIGLRMAVGAQQRSILLLILEQSLRLTVCGILIGSLASIFIERWGSTLWTEHGGPGIYLVIAGVIAITTLIAAWIPAFKATRIDPIQALRYE